MAAARAADDKLPPHSTEDLEQAASRLFELPDLSAPGKKAARSAKKDGGQPAAAADHGAVSIKNRSLAVIERSERRRRRKALIMLLVELLALAAIGGGIWLWRRGDLGARPAPRNYGTEVFDTTAANYLGNARQKLEDVAGYIAFPGIDGQFVYTQPSAGVDGDAAHGVCFAGENWLGSAAPSNTTLRFTNSLADFEDAGLCRKITVLRCICPAASTAAKSFRSITVTRPTRTFSTPPPTPIFRITTAT